jgi:hypothetical protein
MDTKKGPPDNGPNPTTSHHARSGLSVNDPAGRPRRVRIDEGPSWAVYAWRWSR